MNISNNLKGFILAIIVFSLFLYGYRYYEYTQKDPDFCISCHAIQDAYIDIQLGSHRDVICQKCHEIGIMEQNERLGTYIFTGKNPVSLAHGLVTPWKKCRSCHEEAMSQGAVSPSKSYGHAKHVLEKKIDCKTCHSSKKHKFGHSESACLKCHADKEVHGLAVDDFSCLQCHRFSERALTPVPRGKCTICHTEIPAKGAMATFSCHYCHQPHKNDKPTSASCTNECHRSQKSIGEHGLHEKNGIDCMYCHNAHTWTVGDKAKTLCSQCHKYRDPRTFVYMF